MALPAGYTLRLDCLGRSNFNLDANDKAIDWIDQGTYGNFSHGNQFIFGTMVSKCGIP